MSPSYAPSPTQQPPMIPSQHAPRPSCWVHAMPRCIMKILQDLRDQGRGQDLTSLLKLIPYALFLGLQVEQQGNEVITVLPFQDHLVGNTNLPAVHGGVATHL